MFTIINSIKNIYRYKNKYVIFGILYLIMICAISVFINIYIGVDKIADDMLRDAAAFKLIIRGDNPNIRAEKGEYLKFKNLNHVEDIKLYQYNFINNPINLKDNTSVLTVKIYTSSKIKLLAYSDIFILGYNTSLLHILAEEFNLEKGRMFDKIDECVVSVNTDPTFDSGLWNSLDIGDKIIISNNDAINKEFTVVGIQKKDNRDKKILYTSIDSAEYFDTIASATNISIFLQNDQSMSNNYFNSNISKIMGYNALIYLDSYENFSNVYHAMKRINEGSFIEPLFQDFHTIRNFILNIKQLNISFITITSFVLMCVTIIFTIILINSRKYEIAILRSIGMKKSLLIINYFIETLTFIWGITIVALIISPFVANVFINNILTDSPLSASFSNVNVSISLPNIGIVFGGTTVVVMLSLVLTCFNIIRLEPLKIFNKQY